MKKLITSLAVISMLMSVPAQARDRDYNREHQKERKRSGCGWLCGAIIGSVVVGVLSSKERNPEDRRSQEYDNRYYPPDYKYDRRYCVREQIVEWRHGERYIYWQTTCN